MAAGALLMTPAQKAARDVRDAKALYDSADEAVKRALKLRDRRDVEMMQARKRLFLENGGKHD